MVNEFKNILKYANLNNFLLNVYFDPSDILKKMFFSEIYQTYPNIKKN